MSSILVVHNPRSHRGAKVFAIMKRWLQGAGLAQSVEFVEVTELKNASLPTERLVVSGGDGTINSALEWFYREKGDAPVGFLPAGTGNCLAAEFGLPKDYSRLCEIAFRGTARRPLDVLTYQVPAEELPRLILQSSCFGLPANVGLTYERLRQNRRHRMLFRMLGNASYNMLAMFEIRAQRIRERRGEPVLNVKVAFPPEEGHPDFEGDVLAMFIQNEAGTGGNLVPCPLARVDDGLMDICIFRASTGHSYIKMLGKLGKGRHLEDEEVVSYYQSKGPLRVSLSFSQPFSADGDIWLESDEFEFAIEPRRFEILVGE